eukprot:741132-Hanusia_phi.AAC.5
MSGFLIPTKTLPITRIPAHSKFHLCGDGGGTRGLQLRPQRQLEMASGGEVKVCGLGMKVERDGHGNIVVRGLAPGGPAESSRMVKEGDVIYSITNKKVHVLTKTTPLEYVKKKIMGMPKSKCRLVLIRNGEKINVELTRGGFVMPSASDSSTYQSSVSAQSAQSSLARHEPSAATREPTVMRSRTATHATSNSRIPVASTVAQATVVRGLPVNAERNSMARSKPIREAAKEVPYCGIGIEFVRSKFGCTVVSVKEGSAADAVGTVEVGDCFLKVDGRDVQDMSLSDIRKLLLGPVGTMVRITILRKRLNWAMQEICLSRYPTRERAFQPTMSSRTGNRTGMTMTRAKTGTKTGMMVGTIEALHAEHQDKDPTSSSRVSVQLAKTVLAQKVPRGETKSEMDELAKKFSIRASTIISHQLALAQKRHLASNTRNRVSGRCMAKAPKPAGSPPERLSRAYHTSHEGSKQSEESFTDNSTILAERLHKDEESQPKELGQNRDNPAQRASPGLCDVQVKPELPMQDTEEMVFESGFSNVSRESFVRNGEKIARELQEFYTKLDQESEQASSVKGPDVDRKIQVSEPTIVKEKEEPKSPTGMVAGFVEEKDEATPQGIETTCTVQEPANETDRKASAPELVEIQSHQAERQVETSAAPTGDGNNIVETKWYEFVDDDTQQIYYFNPINEESVWELPPGGIVVPYEEEGEDEEGGDGEFKEPPPVRDQLLLEQLVFDLMCQQAH